MVLTRSGTVVKRPGVRFKRGSGVRKVLEFDDSGVFSDSDDNLSPVSYTHKPKGILKITHSNDSFQVADDSSDGQSFSEEEFSEGADNSSTDGMYDVSGETGQRLGGPCRDAVIFLLVTSVCYFVTSFTCKYSKHVGYYKMFTV